MNLTNLFKSNYDKEFLRRVYQCPIVTYQQLKESKIQFTGEVRIVYRSRSDYKIATKKFGLMDDFKSGVPRTAYQGIVTFYYNGNTVHLSPHVNWKGYDPSWS